MFISYLNIANQQETYDSIDTSTYTITTIQQETNEAILNSWCIKNLNSTVAEIKTFCNQYWNDYYIDTLITIMMSVAVVVFKVLVKFVVIGVAKFQRYTDHT